MNELIYYDLKQISGLTGSLASQVARELGRRIVSGIYAENDLIEDERTEILNILPKPNESTLIKQKQSLIDGYSMASIASAAPLNSVDLLANSSIFVVTSLSPPPLKKSNIDEPKFFKDAPNS